MFFFISRLLFDQYVLLADIEIEGGGVPPPCRMGLFAVHLHEFVDILSGVAEARYLVLSAEFSFAFEPFVEESWTCHDDLKRLQRDVLVALSFIVGVDGLQRAVEDGGELIYGARHLGEVDDPLVSALGIAVHEDGCCCVVFHLCTSGHTCLQ